MLENRIRNGLTPLTSEIQPMYDLSMVIPTRNELGNIEPLLMRIHQALKHCCCSSTFH